MFFHLSKYPQLLLQKSDHPKLFNLAGLSQTLHFGYSINSNFIEYSFSINVHSIKLELINSFILFSMPYLCIAFIVDANDLAFLILSNNSI